MKTQSILRAGIRFVNMEALKRFSFLLKRNITPVPSLIQARITQKCNLRCTQCTWWKKGSPNELPLQTWKRIILDIKNTVGPYFLRFYGGEPFCRNDFLELIDFCARRGITTLITTNGTLINAQTAAALIDNRVNLINISLDGHKAETHDRLRGVPGTHQKVLCAIECLRGKVPVQLNTTLMEENIDEILPLSEFARKNGLDISFQGYNSRIYRIGESPPKNERPLSEKSKERISRVIDELCHRKKYNKYIRNSRRNLNRLKLYYQNPDKLTKTHCEAVGTQLMVKDNGDVVLCSFCSRPLGVIGNLTGDSLRKIWKSPEAVKRKNKMLHCPETSCLVIRGCYEEGLPETIAKVRRYILKNRRTLKSAL